MAKKKSNGAPGLPIGNDDGAIMLFEELSTVVEVKKRVEIDIGEQISIFKVNIVFAGEVVI